MHTNLEIRNLRKSFGSKIIYKDLSFSFTQGCYVFSGPNGIGKSVLMEMLAGVTLQDAGSITLQNTGLSTSLKYKKQLTYIPSAPTFFPSATGESFLKFVNSTKDGCTSLSTINQLIDELRLTSHLRTPFSDMSLGTQKKLFLATLAMGNSKLIVMDEPTNALDEKSYIFLEKIITSFSHNKIIIITTHDQHFLKKISHNTIKLDCIPTTEFVAKIKDYNAKIIC